MWRVPPYDGAIAAAEAYVRATWNVHGIVVAGSIVRGEAGPTSDFDIVVVHAESWRLRDQRRFDGVPAELFVNPPERIRRYFENEHREGRPCTANMLATGEVLPGAEPIVDELVAEAREWLAKPLAPTTIELTSRRYGAVDTLDDARDVIASDPAAAALLLRAAVEQIAAYAFWQRAMFQPRRKDLVRALGAIDPIAADHVRAFAEARGEDALRIAVALAGHVLGVDTFFEWTSDRD
jgi:predicted nucleotidyltransferase